MNTDGRVSICVHPCSSDVARHGIEPLFVRGVSDAI
jgi:hypothetical protein